MLDPSTPVSQRVAPRKATPRTAPRRSASSSSRGIGASIAKTAQQVSRRANPSRNSGGRRSVPENSGRSSRPSRNYGSSNGSSPSGTIGPSFSRGFGLTNKPPSLSSYLATDDVYQNVLRSGRKSLADFLAELGRRRGEATTSYNQTAQSMERDRVQQLADLRDEFASRGLINSGLYGQEQGKFQDQYAQQRRTLDQQQTSLLSDLLGQERNYRREQSSAYETARQEALQRRAARYRIGI